jgi:hypothetical protein
MFIALLYKEDSGEVLKQRVIDQQSREAAVREAEEFWNGKSELEAGQAILLLDEG